MVARSRSASRACWSTRASCSDVSVVERRRPRSDLRVWLRYDAGSAAGDHRHPAGQPAEPARLRRRRRDPEVRGGLGISIVSTPHGVLVDREARKPQRRRRAALLGVVGRAMSRIGKTARFRCPSGVKVHGRPTARVARRRARRASSSTRVPPRRSRVEVDDGDGARVAREDDDAPDARAARPDAQADRQHGARACSTGLHARARDHRRRLPRRGARARRCSSASATRTRSSFSCRRASTAKVEQPDRDHARGQRSRSCSARSRRRSASCARRSRTRARASSTPTRRIRRKAGKAAGAAGDSS